ncbi:UNVERIFIED_CONTAM: hypothetical protein FKN15_039970 [Acipenser sinensis]
MASQTPTSVTPVALSVQGIERGAEYRDLMQKVDHLTNEVAMLRMNVETTRHQRSHYDNRDPRGSETPYHKYQTTSYSSSSPHTHDYTRGARPHSPARDERAHRYEPDVYRSHQDCMTTQGVLDHIHQLVMREHTAMSQTSTDHIRTINQHTELIREGDQRSVLTRPTGNAALLVTPPIGKGPHMHQGLMSNSAVPAPAVVIIGEIILLPHQMIASVKCL